MAADKTQVTQDANDMIEAMKKRERLLRTNKVSLAGVVMDCKALPKSPKTDKDNKPITDENGNPEFYEDKFWCSIGVVGSEEGVLLSPEQAGQVFKDVSYMFEGRLKNRKFIVESITEI